MSEQSEEAKKADEVVQEHLRGVRGEQFKEPLPVSDDPATRVAEEYVRARTPNPKGSESK